jgi:hypothetical protein
MNKNHRMQAHVVTFFRIASLALLAAVVPALAHAQTEGRVSVGGSVTLNATTDDDVKTALGVGPLVRLNPRRGWAPAGAFNWYRADLQDPAGGERDFARLRVRPLMAGIGYTIGPDRTLVNFSVVAGPSFNSAKFEGDFVSRQAGSPAIDADNSFAIRPGISVTQTVAPRVGIVGFAGYMINRPEVTYVDVTGRQFQEQWKADSVVLSVGVVYSIF